MESAGLFFFKNKNICYKIRENLISSSVLNFPPSWSGELAARRARYVLRWHPHAVAMVKCVKSLGLIF